MALLLKTDDKQQWRMAMNNEPFFATHSGRFSGLAKSHGC
jgi:hypothetical protein